MEILKGLVTNLVTALIFITAVELIAPNNNMKKYLKFILGLILITVILNPIVELISKGKENVFVSISDYQDVVSKYDNKINNSDSGTLEKYNNDISKQTFIDNFNKNCDSLLKNKYPDKNFKSEVDCTVDFTDMSLDIKKIEIGISDKDIKKIKKIKIKNQSNEKQEKQENNQYKEVVNFVCEQLNIPKEKIEVYEIEE
ncbi:stage III sporulation protein AF [Clostridium uliginosum]|uniref:Stage III sporulation protein AF n=1 Tax=Clostridium uliginosum TaxID=119641 RepID=A0A1I1NH01_9CLOT|nr:stage III sporulation protein AF [Clostridium uliginosum]SFC96706.1 stage III sporulation protein AF [Clostridium uliginosum]